MPAQVARKESRIGPLSVEPNDRKIGLRPPVRAHASRKKVGRDVAGFRKLIRQVLHLVMPKIS